MTIKTLTLAPDLTVILRKGFEPLTDANGVAQADKHGQPIHVAEAVVPGRIASRFAVDNDRPDTVRLRVVGHNPGHPANSVVRLVGKVTATVWYQPRNRGSEARSDITVTAERVDLAPGQTPATRGGLPALFPADVPALFLGQAADGSIDLMLAAVGTYTVDGLAEIRCTSVVPSELIGCEVVPVGLRGFFVVPDREDTGQRSKSELVLTCAGLERVPASNGRRKPEPTPEPAAAE